MSNDGNAISERNNILTITETIDNLKFMSHFTVFKNTVNKSSNYCKTKKENNENWK